MEDEATEHLVCSSASAKEREKSEEEERQPAAARAQTSTNARTLRGRSTSAPVAVSPCRGHVQDEQADRAEAKQERSALSRQGRPARLVHAGSPCTAGESLRDVQHCAALGLLPHSPPSLVRRRRLELVRLVLPAPPDLACSRALPCCQRRTSSSVTALILVDQLALNLALEQQPARCPLDRVGRELVRAP